jgi:hypothetical protein
MHRFAVLLLFVVVAAVTVPARALSTDQVAGVYVGTVKGKKVNPETDGVTTYKSDVILTVSLNMSWAISTTDLKANGNFGLWNGKFGAINYDGIITHADLVLFFGDGSVRGTMLESVQNGQDELGLMYELKLKAKKVQ